MDQHFLVSYHHAILSVILAQFSGKAFEDGMAGVVRLAEASPYIKVSLCALCSVPIMKHPTCCQG